MTHPRKLLVILVVLAVLSSGLASCAGSSGQPGAAGQPETISVSGAFALFPMVTLWTSEYQKSHPEIRFDVQAGGAGKGMTDVLAGAVDLAMLSREVRQEELDQSAFPVPVAIDAVVATVNADNPDLEKILQTGITPQMAAGIWMDNTVTRWDQWLAGGSGEAIDVYTRADAAGAAEMWARFIGGETQEDLRGTAVNGDPGLAEAVRQDPLGIGFNNIGFAYDPGSGQQITGLRVVPIDLNGDGQITPDEDFYATRTDITQAIADRRYPFPPARELYLVTKGAPSQAVTEFLRWILTDGQALVPGAGYVKLTDARIQSALELLK